MTGTTPGRPGVDACDRAVATIVGTSGDDVIVGTSGDDVIFGLAGNDTISGGNGSDLICGGDGDGVVDGGKGSTRLRLHLRFRLPELPPRPSLKRLQRIFDPLAIGGSRPLLIYLIQRDLCSWCVIDTFEKDWCDPDASP